MGTVKNTVRTAKVLGYLVKKGLLNDTTAKALADAKDQLVQSAGIVLSGGKEAVAELTSAVVRELPKVKMAKVTPDPTLVDLFTKEEALENLVLPLTKDGRVVEVAITEESDFLFIVRRQLMKGLIFRFKTARVTELTLAIRIYYEANKVTQPIATSKDVAAEPATEQPTVASVSKSQVPKFLLDNILCGAARKNYQEVRFLFVDGILSVVGVKTNDELDEVHVPTNLHEPIIKLLRERAELDSSAENTVIEKIFTVDDAIDGTVYRFSVVFSDMFGEQNAHVFPQ
ncbi:MAG: hypothetical protein AAB575_01540 [Patescibacteria group bacterium]